jgi:hypothetical protein
MTHPDTAKMINDQIAKEFETLNDLFTDESDKPAIMKRIADLKAMLDENTEVTQETQDPTLKDIAVDALKAFRERQISK